MAELTISSEEIRSAIENYVASFETETSREEVGIVTFAGDGIARVEGLPSTMTNELLEFPGGVLGVALNLDVREIGAVILGNFEDIEEGQEVKRTGRILSVPVGDNFLGRVVDPLGVPLDGLGDIDADEQRVLELQAPSVINRQPVKEPLQTGIKAIDSQTPIGRGQRQLIIGDRKTGKTAVCIDTILNQKANWETDDPAKQVRCIYVAVGQKGTTIAAVRETLEEAGALAYTTVVAAPASDSAGYKWLAPYTGSAIGQHWMYQGKHVLIIFDDLSKQAEAYRAISLLLRRPPGREAYPGDVFYLHSRLLERCAKLSDELGGGSLTGLPIIETKANDISAYIPTNVISITDGQCFFEADLFNQGVRPAINVGVSVSRVGGNAQIKAMKTVGGTLRLELSQYRELESFAAFGAENLDSTSRRQLERGGRLTELLKQGLHEPMPVEEQVLSIFLGTGGHLDDVEVADVRKFESEFLDDVRRHHSGILDTIRESKEFGDDTEQQVVDAVKAFKKEFTTSDGSSLETEAEADAMDADEVERESVKVSRRGKKDDAKSEKDTAKSEEDTAKSEKDTAKSKEDTAKSKEDTAKSEEDTAKSKEDTAKSKDDAKSKDGTAKSKAEKVKIKEGNAKSKDGNAKK
jgi:F-type H+-transporting ATPase subunit alpha